MVNADHCKIGSDDSRYTLFVKRVDLVSHAKVHSQNSSSVSVKYQTHIHEIYYINILV